MKAFSIFLLICLTIAAKMFVIAGFVLLAVKMLLNIFATQAVTY